MTSLGLQHIRHPSYQGVDNHCAPLSAHGKKSATASPMSSDSGSYPAHSQPAPGCKKRLHETPLSRRNVIMHAAGPTCLTTAFVGEDIPRGRGCLGVGGKLSIYPVRSRSYGTHQSEMATIIKASSHVLHRTRAGFCRGDSGIHGWWNILVVMARSNASMIRASEGKGEALERRSCEDTKLPRAAWGKGPMRPAVITFHLAGTCPVCKPNHAVTAERPESCECGVGVGVGSSCEREAM